VLLYVLSRVLLLKIRTHKLTQIHAQTHVRTHNCVRDRRMHVHKHKRAWMQESRDTCIFKHDNTMISSGTWSVS